MGTISILAEAIRELKKKLFLLELQLIRSITIMNGYMVIEKMID